MAEVKLSKRILKEIDKAVARFASHKNEFSLITKVFHDNLAERVAIRKLIHSTKFRVKDPEHLRNKLLLKAIKAKRNKEPFDITAENLFSKIPDLAGVRLLHLHTKQMADIHPAIMDILGELKWRLVEKPVAYTWDAENEQFFKKMDIKTEIRDSMYTSVHYVVEPNQRTIMRCELQVRTLMEEVWGEVSHTINYPQETNSIVCREQLKVLARVASGCTRLVDSIFVAHLEHQKSQC